MWHGCHRFASRRYLHAVPVSLVTLSSHFPSHDNATVSRFFRLGQKVVIPVMLSQDINPTILFFSTVLPSTAIVASHYFYFKPRRIRRTRR